MTPPPESNDLAKDAANNASETPAPITLPADARLADYQRYITALEARMGWSEVDLVHNCFLMGEEVGELFKAVRRVLKFYDQAGDSALEHERRQNVSEELVDVFNYLLAIANRLEIDLESAFIEKNAQNQQRIWHA